MSCGQKRKKRRCIKFELYCLENMSVFYEKYNFKRVNNLLIMKR